MLSNLDLFLSFMLFLIFYGIYLKIWEQSRTTIIAIVVVSVAGAIAKFFTLKYVLLFVSFCMFMLFVRAVFRKYILKSKYKELFYA